MELEKSRQRSSEDLRPDHVPSSPLSGWTSENKTPMLFLKGVNLKFSSLSSLFGNFMVTSESTSILILARRCGGRDLEGGHSGLEVPR